MYVHAKTHHPNSIIIMIIIIQFLGCRNTKTPIQGRRAPKCLRHVAKTSGNQLNKPTVIVVCL